MAQVEARKSELEEKLLGIEEKEDNLIAYLEAQLENLSPFGDDRRWKMRLKAKGLRSGRNLDTRVRN